MPSLEDALQLLNERGFAVIPLHSPDMDPKALPDFVRVRVTPGAKEYNERDVGKMPLVAWDEWKARLTKAAEAEGWWKKFPGANVGVTCGGHSGVFVVDADNEDALKYMESLGVVPGLTLTARTGRGYQFYFLWPSDGFAVSNSLGQIMPGLDIKGSGGYVVAPPSRHRLGVDYAWIEGVDEPMPAPEELLELIRQASRRKAQKQVLPSEEIARLLKGPILDGRRHDDAKKLFAHLAALGTPEKALREFAFSWGQTACQPPADNSNLQKVVDWVMEQESASHKNPEKPERVREGDNFVFTWPDLGLSAVLKRLQEFRGELTCEITIASEAAGRLHWGRLVLSSDSKREELRRKLERVRNDINWTTILEHICFSATEAFREMSDFQSPKSETIIVNDRHIIEGVIPVVEGTINIIFADMASGKSTMLEAYGIAAAAVKTFPEIIIPRRAKPQNVLFIDTENMRPDDWVLRRKALCAGLGIPEPENFWWFHPELSLWEERQTIKARLDQRKIDLVILDSLAAAAGEGPEKGDAAIRMIKTLQYFNRTALVSAHIPKAILAVGNGNSDGPRTAYGSIFNTAYPRTSWDMAVMSRSDSLLTVRIVHKKINLGKMRSRAVLTFEFDGLGDVPDAIRLRLATREESQPLSGPAKAIVMNSPEDEGGPTAYWVAKYGINPKSASRDLRPLVQQEYLTLVQEGGGRGKQTVYRRTSKPSPWAEEEGEIDL